MAFRICLVNPGKILQPQPPLALAYLAAYLKKYSRGDVEIIIADENTGQNIEKTIKRFKPDLAGITATTPHIFRAGEVALFIKTLDKNIPVVIGGPHVSALPEATLQNFSFDIGIIGEGEETFCELINCVLTDREINTEKIEKIKGLVFKNNGKIQLTAPRPVIDQIDIIPPPARELLDMKFYLRPEMAIRGHLLRSTTFLTSRGCPYNCKFCASPFLTGRKVRFHSPEYVTAEIKTLKRNYPQLEGLFILDDTFTLNQQRIKDICRLFIKEKINEQVKWSCQGRVNLIKKEDKPLYGLMKKAGCIQMEFGFESGSDRILSFIKGEIAGADQNQKAVDIIKDTGLDIFGNFLVGTPTETREEMLMTRDFVVRNLDKIHFFQMYFTTPYPGTQFWNDYNLSEKAGDNNFWKTFHSGHSGYEFPLPGFLNDVDMESAQAVEKEVNYLAARQTSFKYKVIWTMSRFFYAPLFTLKKIWVFILHSIRRLKVEEI